MTEIVVVETSPDEDLASFSQYLWQQSISHRIVEHSGRQLLLVGNKEVAIQVRGAYEATLSGSEALPKIQLPEQELLGFSLFKALHHVPVTLGFVFLSILGFGLVHFDKGFELVRYFTFYDFDRVGAHVLFSLPQTQYWRLITPIFLHFGLMHIAFNMSLLWFTGRQIELLQGSVRMLGISIVIGLGSNILQAMYAEVAIFGGMSGVVYGLLGYGWVWNLLRPEKALHIPNVIFYFSLGMLVLGFVGFIGLLGAGEVANVAHLGGLIIGVLMGLGAGLIDKLASK
jgi:GlpG protein